MKSHEEILRKEVEWLVLLVVLKNLNDSDNGDPSFAQPKPKTNWVNFLGYSKI